MENSNFIRSIIEEDIRTKKHAYPVTRFPPEPNGFLHLGHARAIIMNHTLAHDFGGYFNLRFDDTNPLKEDSLFVEGMKRDIAWLGAEWENLFYASNYFDTMYEKAELLIRKGLAYVCDLSMEAIRNYRGDLKNPGKESPYRTRSVEENLELFRAMRDGKFEDGAKVLRAKIDMSSPNINMRDPIIYRIQRGYHHNTKDKWCIYPMYDFAHPLEDAIEGITHSLCSLEFEDHRPLYNWFVKHCEMEHQPRQIEFGKLKIAGQIIGKRSIRKLVEDGYVDGWDDPRLITLSGLRRRGVPPEAIRNFILALGLPKSEGETELEMLDEYVRDYLKHEAPRIHAVIDPIKVIITNYPDDESEILKAPYNRENEALGARDLTFSNTVYIERDDFLEEKPNKKWKRLSLGIEVRLMHAYFIKANDVEYDEDGRVKTIYATYDPQTKSGSGFSDRKPNGNIHWVDAKTARPATLRLYENLTKDDVHEDAPMEARINPDSKTIKHGFIESNAPTGKDQRFQFVRQGYFSLDESSTEDNPVFNRTVSLKSSFKRK
ncbi:MAG: glutamine--tRNA ligase/YqeY domain fusion protein [Candidatus Izemoplasmataceae bacterium]